MDTTAQRVLYKSNGMNDSKFMRMMHRTHIYTHTYMIISFNDQSKVTNRVRTRMNKNLRELLLFFFYVGFFGLFANSIYAATKTCACWIRDIRYWLLSVGLAIADRILLTALNTNKKWGNQFVDLTLYNACCSIEIHSIDWPTTTAALASMHQRIQCRIHNDIHNNI